MFEMFTEHNYHSEKIKTVLYPYAKALRYDVRYWSGMSTTERVSTFVGTYPPEIFEQNIFKYNLIYQDNSDTYYTL